jgi:hypothetical protein
MRECVKVPGSLLKDIKTLQPSFLMSYEYIKTLNPNPTTCKYKKTAANHWEPPT